MKRKILLFKFLNLLTLSFVFNSCEKEELQYNDSFCKLSDESVVFSDVEYHNTDFAKYSSLSVYYGATEDDINTKIPQSGEGVYFEANKTYYWQAIYSGSSGDTEYSKPRKIYCIDPLVKEHDYCENIAGIEFKFSQSNGHFNNIKIEMIPFDEGFETKTFIVPDGQDSFVISSADNSDIKYMYHDFDDAKGMVYEPVLYKFKVTADFSGEFVLPNVCDDKIEKDILLDKKHFVADVDFNVYRIVEIGDQVWLADDLRYTSGGFDNKFNNSGNVVSELASGSKGILYNIYMDYWHYTECPIAGYHIARNDDWEKLLSYYDLDYKSKLDGYYNTNGVFNNVSAFSNLCLKSSKVDVWQVFASVSDWVDSVGNNICPTTSLLNIKPFGFVYAKDELRAQGIGAAYYCYNNYVLLLCYTDRGVAFFMEPSELVMLGAYMKDEYYKFPLRCVKN